INLSDLSYTLNVGRKHFNYRYSVAVSSIDELIINLEKEQDSYLSIKHITSDIKRKIIFMFPGQGSQYKNMGLDLYQNEVIFRDAVDRCFEILKQNREVDFNEVLFGQSDINESQNSSCAIFIIEYALYQLLKSRGINPDVMIGHSLGEYTSACVSGVLSLKDSLTLVYDRGILINQLSSGSMLSVYIDKDKLLPLMDETVSLAVENSDSLFVVSGSIESIEKLKTELERLGYNTKQIKSTHAFHSHMLEPILDDFKNILKKLNFDNPQIPYISNVTGTMVKPDEVKNIDYWVKHFRGTVNFNSGVKELLKDEDSIIIEVGPGKSLTSLINSNRYKCNTHRIVNTLKSNKEELNDSLFFQNKCSEIWTSGAIIDWKEYYKNEERRRISLPAYAFDKTYFGKLFNIMLDRSKINQDIAGISSNSKTLTYLPSWERDVIPQITIDEKYNYLIFKEELGVSEKLGSKLLEFGKNVVFVIHGDTYLKVSDSEYILDHTKSEDYSRLFRDISDNSFIPERIIHSWSINEKNVKEISIDSVSRDNEFGLYSAFNIAKAINEVDIDKEIEIYFISKDIHNVLGFETLSPSQSLILSALKVISTEFSNIECCNIDLGHYDINKIPTYLIDQIINELNSPITDYQIAFRRNTRWILKYKSIEIGKYSKEIKLKKAGVYLITGGLGGIGLTFSKYLAEEYNAKLVLTTRQDFPDKKEWNRIINDPAENRYKSKIKDLIDFTKSGSEILVCSADVADKNEMVKLVDLVEKKWGLINGVIHTAGIADGKLIQLREKIDIENVLKAKIDGTIILTEILNMCDLDFMVLCSSLTCISGGVGQFAYTAANQFLDSFADSSRLKGNNVTSINWCGWQDVGMLANSTYYKEEDKYQYSIKPLEGVDILKSVLGSSFSNIAVSRFDINAFFEFNKSFNIEDITEQKSIKYYSRPELSVEYCPPTNDIEKRIIEIWQELFGIKGIGIDDDFFELGGHSLKGISFITKIREIFHINLNFDQIYEFSSIQKISQIILNSQNIKNVNKKSNGKREVFKL
ncbi:MAG: SDR family NAD(P)-dependent oxidoreductase, partial [bacterium]|nr:SDR family NAD(P)-dependent oxidoreductase [bacterium]